MFRTLINSKRFVPLFWCQFFAAFNDGETIALAAVEALAAAPWPDSRAAATAVPDARKGERLILVTDRTGASRADLGAHIRENGGSDLLVPSEIFVVAELPLLGSGKVDNPAVARMVRERLLAGAADAAGISALAS